MEKKIIEGGKVSEKSRATFLESGNQSVRDDTKRRMAGQWEGLP